MFHIIKIHTEAEGKKTAIDTKVISSITKYLVRDFRKYIITF